MVSRLKWLFGGTLALLATAGCGGTPSSVMPASVPVTQPGNSPLAMEKKLIKHIVIIIQENRSFDNMFNGYPGANTAQYGTIHTGQVIPLQQVSIAAGYNISHKGKDFFTSYDKGKLDGFDLVAAGNVGNAHGYVLVPPDPEYAYVPPSENRAYWQTASQYVLSDNTFQSNIDASFVAHQYLIRANADSAVDNPPGIPWGCDAAPGSVVSTLLGNQKYGPGISPCFNGTTVADELDTKGLSWKFYSPEVQKWNTTKPVQYGEVWSAMGAIRHIRYSPHWGTDVHWPETDILTDVPKGYLANVTWITPKLENSDHPSCFTTNGPWWVTDIVNTIGQSKFWNDTAILILWDDAGNWYDHVPPPQLDYDGLGFRVPLIILSPYAREGFVIHEQWETAGIDRFVENVFGLNQIAAADTRATDFTDAFNFNQKPRPFVKIPVDPRYGPRFFINQPTTSFDPPDDL
jgi:phospholipase C